MVLFNPPERYAGWLREDEEAKGRTQQKGRGRAVVSELEAKVDRPPTPKRGRESPTSFYRPLSERMLDVTIEARMSDVEEPPRDDVSSSRLVSTQGCATLGLTIPH